MAKSAMKRQPAKTPAAIDLDAGLAGITAMNVEQLRELWRQKRGQEPPAAFSKDLIARAMAYWLQEEVLGGLDARVRKLLGAPSRGEGPPARHVKVGSIIVREYQGKLHEVLVVPGRLLLAGTGLCEPVDHRSQDHRNQLERVKSWAVARVLQTD